VGYHEIGAEAEGAMVLSMKLKMKTLDRAGAMSGAD